MEDRPLGSATKWAFQIFSNSVRFSGIGLVRDAVPASTPEDKQRNQLNLSFAQGAAWSKSRGATNKRCRSSQAPLGSLSRACSMGTALPAFPSRQPDQ